jgi:hypothetical protein
MWVWLWAKGPKMKKGQLFQCQWAEKISAAMLEEARAAA